MKNLFDNTGKVYTLTPRFIAKLQDWFRKLRLKLYKKKKINESKTPHKRYYHLKFKIRVDDNLNPQVSNVDYEMVVPARAAFYAKILLERSVMEKIKLDFVDVTEMSDEQHDEFVQSKQDYATQVD